jgi:hypothetical protein
MRKILTFLLLVGSCMAQTTTYTGTVKDLTNTAVTSGQVSFALQPGIDTTISGTARFVPTTSYCTLTALGAIKALDGVSACTVTSNTSLTPTGTSYKVCIQPNFSLPGSCFNVYALGGSVDLTTVVPTPATSPAYTFVDIPSTQTITGDKTFTGTLSLSTVTPFNSIPFQLTTTAPTSGLYFDWRNATKGLIQPGVTTTGRGTAQFSTNFSGPTIGQNVGLGGSGWDTSFTFERAANDIDKCYWTMQILMHDGVGTWNPTTGCIQWTGALYAAAERNTGSINAVEAANFFVDYNTFSVGTPATTPTEGVEIDMRNRSGTDVPDISPLYSSLTIASFGNASPGTGIWLGKGDATVASHWTTGQVIADFKRAGLVLNTTVNPLTGTNPGALIFKPAYDSPAFFQIRGLNAAENADTFSVDQTGVAKFKTVESTIANGTAPLVVASSTMVTNLNADLLDGKDWTVPGAIGSGTPNTGAFTSVTVGGTALSRYARYSKALTPASVAANTCAAEAVSSVTGVTGSDILIGISKPTEQAGLSVTPGHVTGTGALTLNFCNNTAAPIVPTASETYQFVVVQ